VKVAGTPVVNVLRERANRAATAANIGGTGAVTEAVTASVAVAVDGATGAAGVAAIGIGVREGTEATGAVIAAIEATALGTTRRAPLLQPIVPRRLPLRPRAKTLAGSSRLARAAG